MKALKLKVVYTSQFSPDGQTLVTVGRDIVAWNVASRSKHYRVHPVSHPSNLSFSPDGDRIAIKNTVGRIVILDAATGAVQRELDPGRDGEGSEILFSPCGDYLVDGAWNGALTVRSASSGEFLFRRIFANQLITAVKRSADGLNWFILHSPRKSGPAEVPADPYITVWKWPFTTIDRTIPLPRLAWAIAASPDGAMLATYTDEQLSVIRVHDQAIQRSVTVAHTKMISWSPTGHELGTATYSGITFYSVPDLVPVAEIAFEFACDVKWSPNGELVALGDWKCGLLMNRTDVPLPEKMRDATTTG